MPSMVIRMIPRLKHKVNQLLDFGRLIKSPMLLIIQLIMFITKTMTKVNILYSALIMLVIQLG
jgi:hypothetical protein